MNALGKVQSEKSYHTARIINPATDGHSVYLYPNQKLNVILDIDDADLKKHDDNTRLF